MKFYLFVISVIIAAISIQSTESQDLQISNFELKDLLNLPQLSDIQAIQNDATKRWNEIFPEFQKRALFRAAVDSNLVKTLKVLITFIPLTIIRGLQWIVQTYNYVATYFGTSLNEMLRALAKQLQEF